MLGVLRPHRRRLNFWLFLQAPIVIPKAFSANPCLLCSPAQKSLSLLPTHTRIRNRNTVLKSFWPLRWNILSTLTQMALQHQT